MQEYSYLSSSFWEWVNIHLGKDTSRLRLSSAKTPEIATNAAITQIECRKHFHKKFNKTLNRFPEFYFPSSLACEQATGDLIASYHTRFVTESDILVDMTAGLGNDLLHLAAAVKKATGIERNKDLTDALKYNANGLNINNLEVIDGDSRELIKNITGTILFVDPARRGADGSRVFDLSQCEPDILAELSTIQTNFNRLIVKASPMLDITRTISQLPSVTDIYLIGTKTECKELVVLCDFKAKPINEPEIHAVTLSDEETPIEFVFTRTEEANSEAIISDYAPAVNDWLYIPYPSTMKALPTKLLSEKFKIAKFHSNTHLYFGCGAEKIENFPGEILQIIDVIPWQSKNLKRFKTRYPNVMVTVRNFGMTAEALKSKLGVKEGGNDRLRLFGVGLGSDHTDRILIVAK